jgi:hypothetical protein
LNNPVSPLNQKLIRRFWARRIYGDDGVSITSTNPAVPTIVLQYTSFKQITHGISDARVYGARPYRVSASAWQSGAIQRFPINASFGT